MSRSRPAELRTPSSIHCADEILRWAQDYISRPDPRLGRSGAICPFVPPALKENVFYVAVHEDVDDTTGTGQIEELLADYAEAFLRTPPVTTPERLIKTILPAFPNMSAQRALVLDEIHARMKSFFVEKEMMIGQFHPRCSATAVRNPAFENKKSPIPMFALRHIVVHDILFLSNRRDWFEKYRLLYGARYDAREVSHEHDFVRLYREALRRFSPDATAHLAGPLDPFATQDEV